MNVTDVDDKIIKRARQNKLLADYVAEGREASVVWSDVRAAVSALDAKMAAKLINGIQASTDGGSFLETALETFYMTLLMRILYPVSCIILTQLCSFLPFGGPLLCNILRFVLTALLHAELNKATPGSACVSASKTSAFLVSLVFSASALFFIARASRQLSSPASAEPGFALLSSACSSAVSSEYLAASKSASAFASVRASHDAGAVASVAAAVAAAAAAAMAPTRSFCATSFSEG